MKSAFTLTIAAESGILKREQYMRIAVIGAHGKSESAIVKEAFTRGHEVTAIPRRDDSVEASAHLVKDVFNLTHDDLKVMT